MSNHIAYINIADIVQRSIKISTKEGAGFGKTAIF